MTLHAFLVVLILIELWRNKLMSDNNTALAAITTAVNDATAALKDLATKSAAGADISGPLTALAANLEAAVASVGEPVTPPPA